MEPNVVQLSQCENNDVYSKEVPSTEPTEAQVVEYTALSGALPSLLDKLPSPQSFKSVVLIAQQQRQQGVKDSPEITAFLESTQGLVNLTVERLVNHLPERFGAMDADDLLQEARLGLFEALSAFEPERGLSFTTYAPPRIRGRMIDALRDNDHVPRSMRRRQKNLAQRNPPTTVLKKSTDNFSEQSQVDYHGQFSHIASISTPLSKGTSEKPSVKPETIDSTLSSSEMPPHYRETKADFWRMAMRGLKTQERLILILYYREGITMKEIGSHLDLSESRVSQMMTAIAENLAQKAAKQPQFLENLEYLFDSLKHAEKGRGHISLQGVPLSQEKRTVEAFIKSGTLPARDRETIELQEKIQNIGITFEISEDKAIAPQRTAEEIDGTPLTNLFEEETVSQSAERQLNDLSRRIKSLGLNFEVIE